MSTLLYNRVSDLGTHGIEPEVHALPDREWPNLKVNARSRDPFARYPNLLFMLAFLYMSQRIAIRSSCQPYSIIGLGSQPMPTRL